MHGRMNKVRKNCALEGRTEGITDDACLDEYRKEDLNFGRKDEKRMKKEKIHT